ncbi:hypothetical protein EAY42_19390 [Vibrio anguillarum]|nr:hypothetical protein [Vibrio anguillarum]
MIENLSFVGGSILLILFLRKLKFSKFYIKKKLIYFLYAAFLMLIGSQYYSIFHSGEFIISIGDINYSDNYFIQYFSLFVCIIIAATCLPNHPDGT